MNLARKYPATVMIVDDDHLVLGMVERVLQQLYDEVLAVNSAVAAAQQLEERRVDVLLTDLAMPEVNGVELAAIARRHHPDIRVLFISGFVTGELEHAMPPDARMLTKPFSVDDLIRFIASSEADAE